MSPSLMPHAVCWQQDPNLIWTMVVTNAITFLSYFCICVTLFYLARKTRGVVARDWAFFLIGFGAFIVACGSTHLMEVVTTWVPVFWVDAATNIVTAVFSAYVAVEFARKASELGAGINDYALRLRTTESERARIEKDLEQKTQSLLAARRLEEWNRMSAVISHEINNPLAAIQNLLFLMQLNPQLPADAATIAQKAAGEVKRIEDLTRSTLGFFRSAPAPEPVDLAASADAVRFLLGPMLRQRGIELDIHSQGDSTVNAYAPETRQVLLNLVRNAAEATPQRGAKVTIALEGTDNDVKVVVSDEGSGMNPDVLAGLFQFGMTTKGQSGNGMGLWLVKQLVTRHGGTIEVESQPGKGSSFTVLWPRKIPTPAAAQLATQTSH